ncbi:MAG TPA: carboxypeptidase regulatory-like domain-containing protein [Vicinamibacterales bacterium]|nr:carboxypeptidase regulatory-like domain-containing protein [Vicinamibacterales bacterium]
MVPKSVIIQGGTQGTIGDEFPLSAVVTFSDSTTQTLTTQATWSSSAENVATVSSSGLLKMVAAGACDLKVSYTQQSTATTVQATVHVTVLSRPLGNYTLFGVLSDGSNGRALRGADVLVLGGINNGRSTTTDGNGYYSIPTLLEGSFTIRFTRDGYEVLEQTVVLTADTRRDFQMKALPPPPYLGTYNVTLTTTANSCSDITPGSSGTVTLSGSAQDLTITMRERNQTRTYRGSIDGGGSFSGSGSGVTNIVYPHEFTGGISGRVSGNGVTISGTEGMTITLGCPNGVGTITTNFSGSK